MSNGDLDEPNLSRKLGLHMLTSLSTDALTRSVLAVPPLARNRDLSLNQAENTKLIRHIEAGGIRTLLYGGNANFYHIPNSEYDQVLGYLSSGAAPIRW